jgi:hypothetical protein
MTGAVHTDDDVIVELEQLHARLKGLPTEALQTRSNLAAIHAGLAMSAAAIRGVHDGGARQPRPIRERIAGLNRRFLDLAARANLIGLTLPDDEWLDGERPGEWAAFYPLGAAS